MAGVDGHPHWEGVDTDGTCGPGIVTYRLPVPGGWAYLFLRGSQMVSCFVPTPSVVAPLPLTSEPAPSGNFQPRWSRGLGTTLDSSEPEVEDDREED